MNTTRGRPAPRAAAEQKQRQAYSVKAVHTSSAAPRRGLFSSPEIEQCSEVELKEEYVLLEHLVQLCVDACARYYGQAEVLGAQVLPPEAVSLVEPPDRSWLVRLRCRTQGPQGHREEAQEVQALVTLRGQELCLLFR